MKISKKWTGVISIIAVVACGAQRAGKSSAVVQVSTPVGAPQAVSSSDWNTEWSQMIGVRLLDRLDSRGDQAAWDPQKHPLVFVTTVGPGYGGLLGGVTLPGVAIFDAYTKKIVAYRSYDLGYEDCFEPHGLAVSPDGEWIYLPTGGGRAKVRWLIINARTLKLDKIVASPGRGRTTTTPL